MGRTRAFIVPVCTDATLERDADVPDSFLAVQWTRLPAGETPPAFVERILHLLSGEMAPLSSMPAARGLMRRRKGVLYWAIAAAVALILGYLGIERLNRPALGVPNAASIAVLPLANESGDSTGRGIRAQVHLIAQSDFRHASLGRWARTSRDDTAPSS
jgi:hypothetical protein